MVADSHAGHLSRRSASRLHAISSRRGLRDMEIIALIEASNIPPRIKDALADIRWLAAESEKGTAAYLALAEFVIARATGGQP